MKHVKYDLEYHTIKNNDYVTLIKLGQVHFKVTSSVKMSMGASAVRSRVVLMVRKLIHCTLSIRVSDLFAPFNIFRRTLYSGMLAF